MSMSKQDFIALADVLKELYVPPDDAANTSTMFNYDNGRRTQWANFQHLLADFCAARNPRFNRQRWLGYIAGTNGPNGGKGKVIA